MCIVICTLLQSRPARGAAKESPILFSGATCVEESLHKKEVSAGWQRLPFHFLSLLVEARVYVVDVFLVQAVLGEAQAFTEALEVHDLARTQELDDVAHVRIVG